MRGKLRFLLSPVYTLIDFTEYVRHLLHVECFNGFLQSMSEDSNDLNSWTTINASSYTKRLSITTNFTNKINLTINELRWIMWIELLKNIKNLGLVGVSKPMKDGWGTKMVKWSKILCQCHKCPPACPRHHYKSTSSEPSTTTAANQNLLNQSTILLVLWAPTKHNKYNNTKQKTVQYCYYNPFFLLYLLDQISVYHSLSQSRFIL